MRVMPVPTCPTFIVVAVVEASVVLPNTLRVLCVEMAPAPVVVAFPFIHKGPAMDAELVVEALVNVLTPVTPSVEESVVAPVTPRVLCSERAPAAVVVALPFTVRSPAMDTAPVVEAPASDVRPRTPSVLCNVRAPAAVVVALPFIHKGPATVAELVVEALVSVLTPVTESVPAVSMFVLMVVAAWAMPALTKMTASPSKTVRVVLVMLLRYVPIRFIMKMAYIRIK